MMEEKKSAKVSLITILLIIIIIIMAFYIYLEKTKSNNELAKLGNDLKLIQENLKESSNNIVNTKNLSSEIVSTETAEKTTEIEGTYTMVSNVATDGVDYKFKGNLVEYSTNNTKLGLYEIKDNKIIITYFLSDKIDLEDTILSICDIENDTEVLTIIDEKTLIDEHGTRFIKN